MNRRWLVNKTNGEFLRYLSEKTSLSLALAQILVNRGYKDEESIKDFISPSLENLSDPFLMPDMKKAVERIKTAADITETVFVYGDYDADGITSTALLVSALRSLGLKTSYYIPHRIADGYGFNKEGVRKAKAIGASLIITVDCGISSYEEVSMAVSDRIDVIITDHHEPPEKLPEAIAIINPHILRPASGEAPEQTVSRLAGVGVAYKLAQALFSDLRLISHDSQLEDLLALVAIGTIADSVPHTGENRILVACGLKALNSECSSDDENSSRPWVHALKETAGKGNREFRSTVLSYTIIPRINAVGRLGDANEIVEFFLTKDAAKAKGIASFLEEQNRKRQKIEKNVYKSALDMIDPANLDRAIVLYSSEWHPGVIGIVASRLAEMFYRPTFIFSVKDAVAKGSARSIPSFNIYKGTAECADILLAFGGHSQAAGVKIYAENLPAFKEQINLIVENTLGSEDITPTIEIDAGVELFEVNFKLVGELNLLEPFGNSNQKPVLGVKEIEVIDPRIVGNNHLKMKIRQKSVTVDTIGFCMGNLLENIENSYTMDAVFVPCINEWNGTRSLQLNLKALRPSV
ncbi:MAG: single-stranded-DNA-specific exonuclease RecJ [Candidatus Mariimomonas ferrooxydans]